MHERAMLQHMFIFGVVVPTIITILLFIGFLICWFKFNIKDRIFSKKKMCKGKVTTLVIPAHMKGGTIHKGATQSQDGVLSSHTHHEDEGGGPSSSMVTKTTVTNHQKSKNFRVSEGGCGCEDAEMALCMADNCQNEAMDGLYNPNHTGSPSSEKPELLIQHTFHFPECDGSHSGAPCEGSIESVEIVDDDDDTLDEDNGDAAQLLTDGSASKGNAEDCNYGHFVPLSEAMRHPKTRHLLSNIEPTTSPESSVNSVPNATVHVQ